MKHIGVLTTISILLVSCTRISDNVETIEIDLRHGGEKVSIFDICENVEIIPLPRDCNISNISSTPELTAVHDDRIYVLDENKCTLYAFGLDGSLLCKSSRSGRGPGEFTDGCAILVNKVHNTLDVLDSKGFVMRYTLDDLSFVEKVVFHGSDVRAVHAFAQVDDGYLLYSFSDKNHFFYYSEKENVSSAIATDLPMWYYRDYLGFCSPFASICGGVRYVEGYDGSVYSFDVENSSMHEILRWSAGDKTLNFNNIPKGKNAIEYGEFKRNGSKNCITSFFYMWESQSYYHACVIFDSKPYNLLYRKEDGKTFFFDKTIEGIFILGGVLYENVLYSYCNAEDIGMALSKEYYEGLDADSYFIKYKLK